MWIQALEILTSWKNTLTDTANAADLANLLRGIKKETSSWNSTRLSSQKFENFMSFINTTYGTDKRSTVNHACTNLNNAWQEKVSPDSDDSSKGEEDSD